MLADDVKALVFDVFGTVVDWRATVIHEGEKLGREKGLRVDWPGFADEWRLDGYVAGMERIRRGELPWMKVDQLHRRKLDELLVKHGVSGLDESEIDHFNRIWHRLSPWPDAVAGLTRLRERFIIAPLSNGDVALLTNMAKARKLPWDCILSSELFRSFKPDPRVYLGAADLLGLSPSAVLMVAAHVGDLRAAQSAGLRTAFVTRPVEWGPGGRTEPPPDPTFDLVAIDFVDLAEKLRA